MTIDQQVITLEQAKKLKELGVKQESLFTHIVQAEARYHGIHYAMIEDLYIRDEQYVLWDEYSAFTVAELGEMLPMFPEYSWQTYKHSADDEWRCQVMDGQEGVCKTEAQARAFILIHLLENNIISIQ